MHKVITLVSLIAGVGNEAERSPIWDAAAAAWRKGGWQQPVPGARGPGQVLPDAMPFQPLLRQQGHGSTSNTRDRGLL